MAATPWGPAARGRRVKGSGPLSSPIVFLGEAPGKDEDRQGAPFVGAAGEFLFRGRDYTGQTKFPGLNSYGFSRDVVRLENVIEVRPPDNALWKLSPADIEYWQQDCLKRLEKLQPNVIVPLGNLALNTLRRSPLPLTKKGKWRMKKQGMQGPQFDWRDKITAWRGSIFNAEMNNGEDVKIIPAFHPANVLRASVHYDCWLGDLMRVMGDSQFPELRLDPVSEHLVQPSRTQARDFVEEVDKAWKKDPKHAILVGDIETRAGGRVIDCFGFSLWETFSITFDLENAPWSWAFVAALLRHPIAKGWHFGLYDQFVLGEKGKRIENTRWDTHQMHHCLDPRDDHHLAYCASRDLRVRFWKHEGKEEGKEDGPKNPRKRQRYCGKDACNTRGLAERYRDKLRQTGLLKVYTHNYRRLSAACLHLAHTGILVDEGARRQIDHREKKIVARIRKEMAELAGRDLVATKGLSSPRVNSYFYDALGCKPIYKRGTRNRTASEIAVRRLMTRYKKARPMGEKILDFRMHGKIAQEVRDCLTDDDGRVRSRYSPTTKTNRLHAQMISRKPPRGVNAQNRDRHSDLRRVYIADPKQVLVEIDESQAEDRIASGMSGVKEAMRLARVPPTEIDKHILNATKIYEDTYEDLLAAYQAGDKEADEKRQTGKRTKYACWYGMQGPHMADVTLTETEGRVVLDPDECQMWIETLMRNDKSVPAYQEWIRQLMIEEEPLPSSWGIPYRFKGLRLSKEDFKEGYARCPQHEVGMLMNMKGFVPLDERLRAGEWPKSKIIQQGHDSLLMSVPPEWAWEIAKFLVDSLTEERTYPGRAGDWTLSMPVGLKLGHSWYKMHEWKEMPTQRAFEKKLEEVIR